MNMRHEFAHEAVMGTFHRVEQKRGGGRSVSSRDGRLPWGRAVTVIGGLSLVAWGLVIAIAMAVRALI